MKNEIHVTVTAEHIAAGRPTMPRSCPIALALKEQTGDTWEVYGRSAVCYHAFEPYRQIRLPYPVTEFISRFDTGATVQPMSFTAPYEEDLGSR